MITDREIADKRNEVTMLRLQINEHKERRRLDEIEQKSELPDVGALREANETIHNAQTHIDDLEAELRDEMQQKHVAIRLGAEKAATVLRLNETISDLRMAASDMLDTINECARGEAEDSRVLMQVVEIVKEWGRLSAMVSTYDMRHLRDLLVDYLAAPEPPVVTLETPSIGTRVVSKNEETLVISEAKMKAVRTLVDGGDNWVVCTDEDAVEVAKQKQTIDELTETTRKLEGRLSSMYAANSDQDTTINKLNALLADEKMTLAAYRNNPLSDQVADRDNRIEQLIALNEALRADMELAHNLSRDHIAGQDRFIEGVKTELDARNTVIKDFKAIEQKETDRLHTVIEGNGKIIDELNDMYCDVCGKLERIEKIVKKAKGFDDVVGCISANHAAIDEITKIIQEE